MSHILYDYLLGNLYVVVDKETSVIPLQLAESLFTYTNLVLNRGLVGILEKKMLNYGCVQELCCFFLHHLSDITN